MSTGRWVTLGLLLLLAGVQAQLWFGQGSLPHVWALRAQLAEQRAANDAARARNERIAVEVADLKEGLEIVEEKARSELGMLRPDEILVRVAPR